MATLWQVIHKQRLAWGRLSANVPIFFGNRTAAHRDGQGNTGTELLTNISVNVRMFYGNKREALRDALRNTGIASSTSRRTDPSVRGRSLAFRWHQHTDRASAT